MAVDTRNKRASCITIFLPFGPLPNPDGTIDQADRQHTARSYPGILAVPFVPPERKGSRGMMKRPNRMMDQ